MKMMEMATRQKTILLKKIESLRSKINPLEAELSKINRVITALNGFGETANLDEKKDISSDEPQESSLSVVDMIRTIFINNKVLSFTKLKELLKLGFPADEAKVNRGIYNAIVYMQNSDELVKEGSGGEALIKTLPKLQPPKPQSSKE